MNIELSEQEIATILAALRLFQGEAVTRSMAEAFPGHFEDVSPLSDHEIDYLCDCINESTVVYRNSPEFHWKKLMEGTVIEETTPLNRLLLQLGYAVEDENLTAEEAFDVLNGNRWPIIDIDRDDVRETALVAYEERDVLLNAHNAFAPESGYRFSVEAYQNVAYVTRELVRSDCSAHGAILTDKDCDQIIAEVQELAQLRKFSHSGVYWIANRLAAEGTTHPQLP